MSVTLAPVTAALRALPSGWSWTALGDICDIVIGRTPRRDSLEYWSGSLPWVTISDLNDGVVTDTRERITTLGAEASGARLLASGTLLFSFKLTIGKMAFAGVDLYTNEAIAGLVPRVGVQLSTEYLRYALSAVNVSSGSSHAVKGRTLNLPLLRAIKIPLPPLPEQKRIAAALREQLDAAARMRDAATRATSALSALHESRLRDILSSVADRAYPRVILGSVIKARNDIIHPRDNPSGHGVFVGLEHIESGTGRRAGSEEIDQATLTGRKARFHPGDIVYGYLRPYLNKVWLADFEGLCSVDQYVYVVDQEQADAGYVAGFMRSPLFLSQAPVASGPGQLPRIRLDEIARVELALPPLPEQRRIAAVLREQLDSTTHLRAAVEGQAAEIGRLTAALFRSAFLEGSS